MRTYKIFKNSAINEKGETLQVEAFKVIPDEGTERYEIFIGDIKWGPFQPRTEEETITIAKSLIKIIPLWKY